MRRYGDTVRSTTLFGNAFLDAPIQIAINEEQPRRRDVLEGVIFGELSHLDDDHRERLQRWYVNPLAEAWLHGEFMVTLVAMVSAVSAMSRNVEVLL